MKFRTVFRTPYFFVQVTNGFLAPWELARSQSCRPISEVTKPVVVYSPEFGLQPIFPESFPVLAFDSKKSAIDYAVEILGLDSKLDQKSTVYHTGNLRRMAVEDVVLYAPAPKTIHQNQVRSINRV